MYNGGHRNLGCVAYAREPVLDQILWGACTFWRLFGSAFRTRLARLHNTDFEILASALRSLNVALRPSARCMPVSNTIELGTFGWHGHVCDRISRSERYDELPECTPLPGCSRFLLLKSSLLKVYRNSPQYKSPSPKSTHSIELCSHIPLSIPFKAHALKMHTSATQIW